MLDALVAALACAVVLMIAVSVAAVAVEARLLRKRPDEGAPVVPFTLIKPVKGLDDGLAENFETIAAADPRGLVQTVIALESDSDPAYAAAEAFQRDHPERDIEIVLSGPNPGRMGKTHNMMAGLARAKHPHVVFSDADTRTTAELVSQTGRAFASGREAVFALPRHERGEGPGDLLLEAAVNHAFGPGAALTWKLGLFQGCSGAWMGYARAAIDRVGGLEPISRAIADDFALSTRVLSSGAPAALISAPAPLRESGRAFSDACARLAKWASIIRACCPRLYAAAPLLNLSLLAAALWAAGEASGRHAALARWLAASAFAARAACAAATDASAGGVGAPWRYAVFALSDLAALIFWFAGWRSTISWRGVRYRLKNGGEAEIVA